MESNYNAVLEQIVSPQNPRTHSRKRDNTKKSTVEKLKHFRGS